MELWKLPDRIKIVEAVGAIADGRVKIDQKTQSAICHSSDKKKKYTIKYDISKSAITSDDNSAHWQGRLGYPAIAVLMMLKELSHDEKIADALKNIPWRELNDRFENDYNKTLAVAYQIAKSKEVTEKEINDYMSQVMKEIEDHHFQKYNTNQ